MKSKMFEKEAFIKSVKDNVKNLYRKTLNEASQQEIYQAVANTVKDVVIDEWLATQKTFDKEDPKIVYYMSMEFLMGRALGNNLINLTAYHEVQEALEELGLDINVIEDQEPDPALGNGGLGRLAACFMESLATLGYPAYGCGIRYRYGMFKQAIKDGFQIETPDNWLKDGYPFELRRPEYSYEVKFGGYVRAENTPDGQTRFIHENYQSVRAIPYDMPIVGYNNNMVNTLMIWDAEPMKYFELEAFGKGDYRKAVEEENLARNLTDVLYPCDDHIAGKELRLKQQYFFVSASLQRALEKFKKNHPDIRMLPDKVDKSAVNFFYDLINSWKQSGENLDRPFFQSFCHNRMICIGTGLCRNRPCIIPSHSFFIHQKSHQLCYRQRRMRIIHLKYNFIRQHANIRVVFLEFFKRSL